MQPGNGNAQWHVGSAERCLCARCRRLDALLVFPPRSTGPLSLCVTVATQVLLHVNYDPLIITLIGDAKANAGLLLGVVSELKTALQPIRATLEERPA